MSQPPASPVPEPAASPPSAAAPSRPAGFRWKLGLVHLVVGLAIVALWWFVLAPDRTLQVFVGLYILASAAAFAMLVWWTFFSGLSWRARLIGHGVLLLALVTFVALFRHEGFAGDMMPQFAWRFSPSHEDRAAAFWKSQNARTAGADTASATAAGERLEIADGDWPRFRGPLGDGIVRDASIRTDWDANPPKLVWKHPVGQGWSSFAVVGPYAYTQEQRDNLEAVVCYDAATGDQVWVHTDETRLDTSLGGAGPRATPTIHDSKVYAVGATGLLNCLDAVSGEKLWGTDVLVEADANGKKGTWVEWGLSGSPLILDDTVIVNTGLHGEKSSTGTLAAYDRHTGKRLWLSGSDRASYTTPTLVTIAGTPQILIVDADEVAAYEPATGKRLWRSEWENSQSIHCCAPILLDDETLFLSSGYTAGSTRLKPVPGEKGWTVEELERTPNQFKLKFQDGILHNGHIFGLDETILSAVDAKTLKRAWRKRGGYGYGQMLLFEADNVLLITAEDGTLHLAEAATKTPRELGRFKAIEGTCWNQPAFHNGRLYVRSEREAACFEIGK